MRSYTYVLENTATPYLSAYVGKANDPTKRFEEHIVSVNTLSRSYLANALRKYGIENFKLHIVEWFEGDDAEQRAFVGERDWITYLREAGVHLYNNSPGGYGGKKRATLDETRQRLSKSLQQYNSNTNVRQRKSAQMKDHVRTSEHCMHISIAKRKPIVQLDIMGHVIVEFESALQAQSITNVNRSHICDCCKGRRSMAGGYRWRYKTDV